MTQAHRGFLQQAVEHGEGVGVVAFRRRQDVSVTDGLAGLLLEVGQVLAVQEAPDLLAAHAAPNAAELGHRGGEELGHCGDAMRLEATLDVGADAGDVARFEVKEFRGDVGVVENDETIRLLHVRRDLREQPGRRDAD